MTARYLAIKYLHTNSRPRPRLPLDSIAISLRMAASWDFSTTDYRGVVVGRGGYPREREVARIALPIATTYIARVAVIST